MNLSIIRLFFILAAPTVHAATVFVQPPSVPTPDFRAFVNSNPSRQFVSDWITDHLVTNSQKNDLSRRLTKAQAAYLEGSLQKAQGFFGEICSLDLTVQFQNIDRKAVLYSCLRAAQLSKDEEKQDQWLRRSATLDGASIQTDYFPPPLLKRRAEILKSMPVVSVPLSSLAESFRYLLISGRKVDLTRTNRISIKKASYLVTLISDSYQTVTKILATDDLTSWKPPLHPWIKGTCAHFEVATDTGWPPSAQPYFGEACERPNMKQVLQDVKMEPTGLPNLPTPKSSTFYKKSWFWIGVGVVTAAALIYNNNHGQKASAAPTTTYGFN